MTRDATSSPSTDRQATPGFRRAVTVGGDSYSGRNARERFYVNARARRRQKQKTIRDSRRVPAAAVNSPAWASRCRTRCVCFSRQRLDFTWRKCSTETVYFFFFVFALFSCQKKRTSVFFTSTLPVTTKFVFFSVFIPFITSFKRLSPFLFYALTHYSLRRKHYNNNFFLDKNSFSKTSMESNINPTVSFFVQCN